MRFSLFSTKKSYADIKVEYEALDELRTDELPKNWHGMFSRLQRAITSQIPSFNETVLTVVSNKTPPEEGAKVISIAKESFMAIFAGVMTLMLIIGPNIGVGGIITITRLAHILVITSKEASCDFIFCNNHTTTRNQPYNTSINLIDYAITKRNSSARRKI